jgi:hypothetical protein
MISEEEAARCGGDNEREIFVIDATCDGCCEENVGHDREDFEQ